MHFEKLELASFCLKNHYVLGFSVGLWFATISWSWKIAREGNESVLAEYRVIRNEFDGVISL